MANKDNDQLINDILNELDNAKNKPAVNNTPPMQDPAPTGLFRPEELQKNYQESPQDDYSKTGTFSQNDMQPPPQPQQEDVRIRKAPQPPRYEIGRAHV